MSSASDPNHITDRITAVSTDSSDKSYSNIVKKEQRTRYTQATEISHYADTVTQ